jgi:hypothetical protein
MDPWEAALGLAEDLLAYLEKLKLSIIEHNIYLGVLVTYALDLQTLAGPPVG